MDRKTATNESDVLSDTDLRELAEAMRDAGVHLLEVEGPGQRLRLRLRPSDRMPSAAAALPPDEPSTVVKAESMGHFRAAHPDGLFPACEVGASVEPAQVLGFVQVGLLLLPVAATRSGRLARVIAADNALVGYGAPLFEISHGQSLGVQRRSSAGDA